MKLHYSSFIVASILICTSALAHPAAEPTAREVAQLEDWIPPGSELKRAVLELADGSTEVVTYALTPDGRAVLDGDILITVDTDGRARIANEFDRLWAERAALGRAYMRHGNSFRWLNNTVPFEISVGTMAEETVIRNAMQHIEDRTAVRFVARTTETDYVDFINSDGCHSWVGRQGGRQEIGLGRFGCGFGAAVHEIGHALGLWHEQSRSDRDNHVIVHWGNIEPGREHNFQIRSGFWRGPYEFNSIMHYGSFDFSRNGQPTLTRLDGSTWVAQRNGLTINDASGITDMYKRVRATIDSECLPGQNRCDFYVYSSHGVQPLTSWRWTIEDGNNVIIRTSGFVSYRFLDPGPNYVFVEIEDSIGDRATAMTIVDFSSCTGFRC